MNLQQSILKQYLKHKGKPTLKVISQDTGIQMTRIFRLLNGSTMKIDEYQTFQQRVMEMKGESSTLLDMAIECSSQLSLKALNDIEEVMRRYLGLHQLIHAKSRPEFSKVGGVS